MARSLKKGPYVDFHKFGEFAPTRNFRGHVNKKDKGKR